MLPGCCFDVHTILRINRSSIKVPRPLALRVTVPDKPEAAGVQGLGDMNFGWGYLRLIFLGSVTRSYPHHHDLHQESTTFLHSPAILDFLAGMPYSMVHRSDAYAR
jgi:hypothetical protein